MQNRRLLQSLLVVAIAVLAVPAFAQGVFRCPGPAGVVEYRNNGATKGCVKIETQPIVVVPAVPAPKGPAAAAPANTASGASAAAGFPRVDTGAQRTRDLERRRVLEQEMRIEEEKLASLRVAFNNGEPERLGTERNYQRYIDRVAQMREDIARTEANLNALRREIAGLRD